MKNKNNMTLVAQVTDMLLFFFFFNLSNIYLKRAGSRPGPVPGGPWGIK